MSNNDTQQKVCDHCGFAYVPCPVCGESIHHYTDQKGNELSLHLQEHVREGTAGILDTIEYWREYGVTTTTRRRRYVTTKHAAGV